MNSHSIYHRLIAGSLLATFAVAALAPAAQAGHGSGQYRKVRGYERPAYYGGYTPRRVVEYRHTSHGNGSSTLAGFLGGLAVGAILTSAVESHANANVVYERQSGYCPPEQAYSPPPPAYCPPPRDDFSYNDPYAHERYASLDLYMAHTRRGCNHPLVVQVIDNRDGNCVDVIQYDNGRWQSCDRDTRDRYDEEWGD